MHCEASHRLVDTFVQLPTVLFNSRHLWAVDDVRFVAHGNATPSYDKGTSAARVGGSISPLSVQNGTIVFLSAGRYIDPGDESIR